MTSGRVVVVGAVHESRPLLKRFLAERRDSLAAVVTLEDDLLSTQSGAVDLTSPATAAGVPVLKVRNLNSPASIDRLKEIDPDLLVVVGWTRLLSAQVLDIPANGAVGFHASLLPENRGRAPVNWALIRGERVGGNTMMLLDAGTDTGGIVDQVLIPFSDDDTCATIYDRVADAGAEMLMRNLDALADGHARSVSQDPDGGTANGKRTPEMGVIDWRRSSAELHNWVRAQTRPYPGAFGTLAGQRVRLWSSTVAEKGRVGSPGRVLAADDNGLLIQCGIGALHVIDWDVDGASRETIAPGVTLDPIDDETRDWSLGLGQGPS